MDTEGQSHKEVRQLTKDDSFCGLTLTHAFGKLKGGCYQLRGSLLTIYSKTA